MTFSVSCRLHPFFCFNNAYINAFFTGYGNGYGIDSINGNIIAMIRYGSLCQ
jgi:hypothetical protein